MKGREREDHGVSEMEFCPDCGTRLVPTWRKEEKKSTLYFLCPKCGYEKQTKRTIELVPKVIEHMPQERVVVIGKEEQKLRTLPTVRMECPRCGNNLAYVWQVQTRGSDESSTQFFRCTRCSHTFREYS